MGLLTDVVGIIEKWDGWKAVREQASRVPELERRITELEEKLTGKYPPEVCKFCGERAVRMSMSYPKGSDWTCGVCRRVEVRGPIR